MLLYPHGTHGVRENQRDEQALYFTRAWESNMFIVMADCSWKVGDFERLEIVPYPYDFLHHTLNQSCIVAPAAKSHEAPFYVTRALRDEQDGLLIADIDPSIVNTSSKTLEFSKQGVSFPWESLLEKYRENGQIEWME